MHKKGVDRTEAERLLIQYKGHVAPILEPGGKSATDSHTASRE